MAWLLEGDPSIRWQVLRDLTPATPEDIETERALVATTGWGAKLLALQDPDGKWGGGHYGPKWISTTYTLRLLHYLGLDTSHPAARRGMDRLFERAEWYDGGVGYFVTVEAETCVINEFADLTHDHQFIHVDPDLAAATPLGGTVAHGMLILSILGHLMSSIPDQPPPPEGLVMVVNYGFDRMRFIEPVRSGSSIRASNVIKDIHQRETALQVAYEVTVETEESNDPLWLRN